MRLSSSVVCSRVYILNTASHHSCSPDLLVQSWTKSESMLHEFCYTLYLFPFLHSRVCCSSSWKLRTLSTMQIHPSEDLRSPQKVHTAVALYFVHSHSWTSPETASSVLPCCISSSLQRRAKRCSSLGKPSLQGSLKISISPTQTFGSFARWKVSHECTESRFVKPSLKSVNCTDVACGLILSESAQVLLNKIQWTDSKQCETYILLV